jgi:hypothetical protein
VHPARLRLQSTRGLGPDSAAFDDRDTTPCACGAPRREIPREKESGGESDSEPAAIWPRVRASEAAAHVIRGPVVRSKRTLLGLKSFTACAPAGSVSCRPNKFTCAKLNPGPLGVCWLGSRRMDRHRGLNRTAHQNSTGHIFACTADLFWRGTLFFFQEIFVGSDCDFPIHQVQEI